MSNNEINVDELMKRILEEEAYVKSQTVNYDEYLPEFFARAQEDLEVIESGAIALENNNENMNVIDSMFRSFHNIKGSSGFVAQENIQNIAHQTETLLDGCRKGLLIADKHIIDLILKSADLIKQLCEDINLNIDETFLEHVYSHIQDLEKIDSQEIDDNNTECSTHFTEETKQYFATIEKNLEKLATNTENPKLLNSLFKDFHSIKGLSGFSGKKVIQRIASESEKLLNQNKDNINIESVNLLKESVTLMKDLCRDKSLRKDINFLEKICFNIQKTYTQIKLKEITNIKKPPKEDSFFNSFIIETVEHLENIEINIINLEKEKDNLELINSLLRSFHAIKGLSGFASQHLVEKITHQAESLLQAARQKNIEIDENIINLILKVTDYIKELCNTPDSGSDAVFINKINELIQEIENAENDQNAKLLLELTLPVQKKIGEILVEQKVMTEEQVKDVLEKQKTQHPDKKFGEIAMKENNIQAKEILTAIRTQQKSKVEDYMRISTSKVDSLVDMVGELVINQSLIEQYAVTALNVDNIFLTNFNRMARITKDLQNLAMFLRLVPLKSTFQKITRVARDTINELGKSIDFSTSGDETEIDRIITEKLLDPLVHLVKNAISHGIESSEDRIKSGKKEKGNIKLTAYNKRGNIYIEITDDGGGINTERIYQKALEKGLIDPNKEYSEKEMQEFIMLPGFSTIDVANNISGRGVGMDVVKTEILKIGGKVEIDSKKDIGTKFTLKIPLNHAIMNGLIVDIGGTKYILPTVNVKQIVQPKEENWIFTQGKCTQIKIRDEIMPIVPLKEFFGKNSQEESRLVIVMEMDGKYIALPVNNVINRQEVVIKPVGEEFAGLDFVAGMSILGDGKVSLILDIESMFNRQKAI